MSQARRSEGFTLVELLVVVGVITILASITMPALLRAFSIGQSTKCVSNIGQIIRASVGYTKANDQFLVCAGSRAEPNWSGASTHEHDWNISGAHQTSTGPCWDGAWDRPWWKSHGRHNHRYPYWYETLQPYTSPGTSWKDAVKSYNDRNGTSISPDTTNDSDRNKIREELAKLCGIYTCPGKKQAAVGYGMHYAAVYGVSGVYVDDNTNSAPFSGGNPYFEHYEWRSVQGKAGGVDDLGSIEYNNFPKMYWHDPQYEPIIQSIPVLWYQQNIPAAALSTPSKTIAFCDTGWITNDPNPDTDPVPADEWEEHDKWNDTGYVRFPLDGGYVSSTWYKTRQPWRPAPRHNGKTVIGNFDGSARIVDIQDIVGYPYGHPKSLYSNDARQAPPLAPDQ
jgi:prepilin-type N-terminal cleavage/methylation domain-containing protein